MEKKFKIFLNDKLFMKGLTYIQVSDFIANVNWKYLNLIDQSIYFGEIEGLGIVDIIYDMTKDLSTEHLPSLADELVM